MRIKRLYGRIPNGYKFFEDIRKFNEDKYEKLPLNYVITNVLNRLKYSYNRYLIIDEDLLIKDELMYINSYGEYYIELDSYNESYKRNVYKFLVEEQQNGTLEIDNGFYYDNIILLNKYERSKISFTSKLKCSYQIINYFNRCADGKSLCFLIKDFKFNKGLVTKDIILEFVYSIMKKDYVIYLNDEYMNLNLTENDKRIFLVELYKYAIRKYPDIKRII